MALTIGDNFSYMGAKPLDARLKYDTITAMASMSASTLYDGIIAYCSEDGKTYQWKSGNTTDPTLGKWREFETGGTQVQADWEQTTTTEPDYIKNKPTLGTAAEKDSTNAVTQSSTDLIESGAVYSGLDGKVDKTSVGTASGVAELDATGKVPSSQLPSFVDDVVDGYLNETDGKFYEEDTYTTEIPGEAGKIYVSVDSEIQYRWTGSAFSPLGGALVLGETSSTAYRGDRGKAAYDFSQNPATATPEMDGVGAAGSSGKWAREDHVHPSDTTKADNDIIAPAFDETETYAIGDRVTYNGGLYRFTSSHTGAWVAGDVTEVTVDGEIPQELTSAQMQAIKDAFEPTVRPDMMPVLVDETESERFIGWYKFADGTKKPLYEKWYKVTGTWGAVKTNTNIVVENDATHEYRRLTGWRTVGTMLPCFNHIDASSGAEGIKAFVDFCIASGKPTVRLVNMSSSVVVGNTENDIVSVQYTKTTDTPVA